MFSETPFLPRKPQANLSVDKGTIIYITISKGVEKVKLQIPYGLAGRPVEEVKGLLETMEIPYIVKYVAQTKQYSHGTVTGTDLPEGVMIDPEETYLIVYVADDTPLE